MNPVQAIEHLLYQVSSGLYLPVIAGCLGLVAYVPWLLGSLAFDALARRRAMPAAVAGFDAALQSLAGTAAGVAREAAIERLLQTHELALHRALDRVRFVIKVGPALGLMGTLIPMGISLAALAEGNVPKMAGSMVTAFTATVAGLGAGVAAYLIALVRERWAREDLREMAYRAELAAEGVALHQAVGERQARHERVGEGHALS